MALRRLTILRDYARARSKQCEVYQTDVQARERGL